MKFEDDNIFEITNQIMQKIITSSLTLALILLLWSCGAVKIAPPEKTTSPVTKKTNRLIMSAMDAKNKRRYNYAIKKFEKALELNPSSVATLNGLIDCYWAQSDCEKVIEYGALGIQYKSDFYNKFVIKTGNCLALSGKVEKALELYNLAISLDSLDFSLYYNRGLAFAEMKDFHSSKSELIKTIEMQTNYGSAHWGFYNVSMALSDYRGATSSLLFMYMLASNSPTAKENLPKLELLLYPDSMIETGYGKRMMVPQMFSSARNKILRNKDGFSHLKQFMLKFIEQMAKYSETGSDFVISFYGGFFKDLIESGFEEEFCYYIFSDSEKEVVNDWMSENNERIIKFENWLKSKKL
jgi:tetratricopeptide (TPR) repeat protein